MPRAFFEAHVRSNYIAWLIEPTSERLAKNAVADLNNMAARALAHWRTVDPAKVYAAADENSYRKELAARECADFTLIRDVAEAHKHVELTRRSRLVTRFGQTAGGRIGFGEALGESLGGDQEIVIVLDDGSKRSLRGVAENVYETWLRLLVSWGL